ncbi:hypothetical protein [Azonexus sp.]|uniref:hypothetical protein n=1 Tax=Azonexus sp. TaxID=1872668 RepID=UPI0035B34214
MLPRSADIGHAMHLAQQARVFVQKPRRPGLPFSVHERRNMPPCFQTLHVSELTRYLKQRLLTVEK